MKVAIVYDRVNKFGGAERLLLAIHRLYPEAPIYTLVHDPKNASWAEDIRVIPTFVNKIGFLRRKHEWLAPIAPLAFESHNLSGFDVVISVTSGDAKSVITRPHQLHVCYSLTPTRYFWSGEEEYSEDKKMKYLPPALRKYFRTVDLLGSKRPDEYVSISDEVKKRVKKYYNRESSVVYPPIEDKFYTYDPVSIDNRDYYLVVSRLVPYKKVDLVISAFNKMNKPLVVIGDGSEREKLNKLAGPKVNLIGAVSDNRLIEYYRHAKAVIFPQEEDFGLVPVEAQALGTPVIAYAGGGALETVIHGQTGMFFEQQEIDSLSSAVTQLKRLKISVAKCRENAQRYNEENFRKEFSGTIDRLWLEYSKRNS